MLSPHGGNGIEIDEFEKAFGKKPDGTSKRKDQGEEGRFRVFDRELITDRNENLDLSWLKDENSSNAEELPEPDEIAAQIRERLQTAMEEMAAT